MQRAIELLHQGRTLRGMAHIPDQGGPRFPAAIVFHGFTADKLGPHQIFLKLSRALAAAGVACFRFDFSGSGESDGDFQDITLSREVEEGTAILDFVRRDDRIDASRVALIGHSMGGLVASIVAGERPADVQRLALIAPAGNLREFVLAMAQQVGALQPGGVDANADVFDLDGNLVGRSFAIDLLRLNAFDLAQPYQGDVLLIHGTDDATVPLDVSSRYQEAAYANRARLIQIDGANHTFDRHVWESEVISEVCGFLRP